jgi:predicted metal-binding membrane protein
MFPIARTRAIFAVVAALLFAGSATATVLRLMSMTAMSGTPMPGGWTLSATWLPLCGRTWLQTATSFVSMWATMTPAMMLPALAPMLWRERSTLTIHSGWLIILNAGGYFMVWLLAGMAIFPLGAAMASLAIRVPSIARAAPVATGFVVMAAGVLQCTSWKAKRLQSCHSVRQCHDAVSAVRVGMRFALQCASCCGNWMAVLLATGVMDREATLIVSAAIAIERVAASRGALVGVFRVTGAASMAAGFMLIAYAI